MGKRFDREKLAERLASWGFVLNLPEVRQGGISFVRNSSSERLYEHILISPGTVAYAEAVISAATFTSCHARVSETDDRLRTFLSESSWYRSSALKTRTAAEDWQRRLVDNADDYCKAMANDKGPLLFQRLLPVFAEVDSYIERLGDLFAVLDREFAFLSEASPDEQATADRLATFARSMLYLNFEDAKLASAALVRFSQGASAFTSALPHRDEFLAARLILLTDYVRAKRLEYDLAGGLRR